MRYILGCVLSAMLASMLTVWWVTGQDAAHLVAQERGKVRAPTLPPEPSPLPRSLESVFDDEGLTPDEAVNVSVYEIVNRGVVNITSKSVKTDRFFLLELQSEGSGSGSVLDKKGHILTNNHVVENAQEIAVTMFNGKTHDATLVGADPVNDIAVLKIEAPEEELHPVALGDSSKLRVGMRVFALGNPFGLERTLTTGIISSLNRSLQIHGNRTIKSIIQIDAAINPGNSGGPLLDAHGRLIGINSAIASTTGQSAGVGFAIPVTLVSRVVPQLLLHGRVIRPEIGIVRVYQAENGLLIAQLKPGGPAERAGLQGPKLTRSRRGPFVVERYDRSAADLITAVDGEKIHTADDFLGIIESKRPGDRVVLTIIRGERELQVPVVLGSSDDRGEKI